MDSTTEFTTGIDNESMDNQITGRQMQFVNSLPGLLNEDD